MLRVETKDGVLRIKGEIPIPAALAGQWPDVRLEHLRDSIFRLITETVEAAEFVDDACRSIDHSRPVSEHFACDVQKQNSRELRKALGGDRERLTR
jgi:hypothetical protein